MATIKYFYDIEVWKKSRVLNKEIYEMTNTETFRKDFVLVDQIRRASISIMANVAEGFGRKGNKEFLQFLSISQASLNELQSHLYIALDINYLPQEKFEMLMSLTKEVDRLLNGLIEYLKKSEIKGYKFKD
jgi:four helix bundle protein